MPLMHIRQLFENIADVGEFLWRSSIKDIHENTVKIDPPPCPLLSTLGHTPSRLLRTSANVIKYWGRRQSLHPANITRCPPVTAVGTDRTQCWLQAVSRCCLSVYCLYLERLGQHAAIYSACTFITIFVTKYHTLLHVADVRTP